MNLTFGLSIAIVVYSPFDILAIYEVLLNGLLNGCFNLGI